MVDSKDYSNLSDAGKDYCCWSGCWYGWLIDRLVVEIILLAGLVVKNILIFFLNCSHWLAIKITLIDPLMVKITLLDHLIVHVKITSKDYPYWSVVSEDYLYWLVRLMVKIDRIDWLVLKIILIGLLRIGLLSCCQRLHFLIGCR